MGIGLVTRDDDVSTAFCLDRVDLTARLTNLTYNMKAELKYVNTCSDVVEGKYVFPIGNVAIYYFRAIIEDREVICECRPRAEAKQTYDEAVEEGHSAFLSEQDEQCEDMFQLSIGNVPANASIGITLKYVGHLEAENVRSESGSHGRVTMTLPQVLNPRYTPAKQIEREYDRFEDGVTSHKYKITLEATMSMPHEITDVHSLKDTFTLNFTSADHHLGKAILSDGFVSDHDLQMSINLKSELSSCVAIAKGGKTETGIFTTPCFMIQIMPDFTRYMEKGELRTELIFVMDRSGSMSGTRINHAKGALLLFLKSIPTKCRFQIIGFGYGHKALFPEPVDYTKESLETALKYQKSMEADMGGTEVYGPLKAAMDYPLTGKGWYREIIFLTDGDVMNANEVIRMVRANVAKARLFAIGIGEGANNHLVSGVANAGRGMAVYLRDGSQLQSVVSRVLNTALQPRASDVQMEVRLERRLSDGRTEPVEAVVVPKQVPPILAGCFNTTYALVKSESLEGIWGKAMVKFDIGGQEESVSLDLTQHIQRGCTVETEDNELHRLAGKCQINELTREYNALRLIEGEVEKEDDEAQRSKLRRQIERLSCQLNVLSVFTALVGVDPKKQDEVAGKLVMRSSHFELAIRNQSTSANLRPVTYSSGIPVIHMALRLRGGPSDSSEPTVPEKLDTFTELVSLQQFDGFWVLNETLADQIGIGENKLQKAMPKEWSGCLKAPVPLDVWATALAIAYFEFVYAERRMDWKLLVSKSLAWMAGECQKCGAVAQEAEQVCKSLIQNAREFLEKSGVTVSHSD